MRTSADRQVNGKSPAVSGLRSPRSDEPNGLVQSVTRALTLLELIAANEEGFRLVDLAENAGLAPSTTHRLLTTMEQKRFVRFDREFNRWRVGDKCFSAGAAFVRRRDIVSYAVPFMRRLRDVTGQTVNLGIEDEGELIVLNQIESKRATRAVARPGGRTHLHASGLGKALLSGIDDTTAADLMRRRGMAKLTAHTITRWSRLCEDMLSVRTRGYALDDEESSIGLRCIAAPIFGEHGRSIAAISVSGLKARIADDVACNLGVAVARIANEITVACAGQPAKNRSVA